MIIQDISVEQITPYENNPRINNKAAEVVRDSITKYGFTNPILLNKQNVIVSGHTRFKAALALGLKTVPCLYIEDLTEAQIREFRIIVNKSGEYSEWDFGKLNQELSHIRELDRAETKDLANMFGLAIGDKANKSELTKDKQEKSETEDDNVVTCPYCGHSFNPDEEEVK